MRSVGLVTSSRSDWGIFRPVAEALAAHHDIELTMIAGGMHLAPQFGASVNQILADGFEVAHRIDFLEPGDQPGDIAASMGRGVLAFAELFSRWRPDILLVLGDRFDMFPAVVAAQPFLIPVAHLHGGEMTLGAIDDGLRHATTKMSHIHLVATDRYAQRIRQMGERPEHVHVVGAPGLDDLLRLHPVSDQDLKAEFGFVRGERNYLVIFHPVTRQYNDMAQEIGELLHALEGCAGHIVIVRPNADTANHVIQRAIDGFCETHAEVRAPANLARRVFLSLMRSASVMIGNSSAGILEAPSFHVPVVNIGMRQEGRVRAANVIDVEPEARVITEAIRRALSPEFVNSLTGLVNPYGDGRSASRVARILADTPLGSDLILKRFADE